MIAWKAVEIPFSGSIGRRRGRRSSVILEVTEGNTTPFSCKCMVPLATHLKADLMIWLSQKLQRLLVEDWILKQQQKLWEDRLGDYKQVVFAKRWLQAESYEQSLQNKRITCKEPFLRTTVINFIKQLLLPTFVAVCGDVVGKVPVVDDVWLLVLPRTKDISKCFTWGKYARSLNFKRIANITLISDRSSWFSNWNLSSVLVTKLTIEKKVKGTQGRNRNGCRKTGNRGGGKRSCSSDYLHTHYFGFNFSNVEMHTDNQQIYHSYVFSEHKSYICNNFRATTSEHKRILHCDGCDYVESPDETIGALLSEPFQTMRMNKLSKPKGLMLYSKLVVGFFSNSDLIYSNMRMSLQQIKAIPTFYMISDNPKVTLGIDDGSLYTGIKTPND